jgi:hypothetical protein
MSRTLTQLSTDVRRLLDDNNDAADARYSSDDVTQAIYRAAQSVGQFLAANGWDVLSSTEVSLASGLATVPANDKIVNVYVKEGNSTYRIRQGSGGDRIQVGDPTTATLVIEYIAKNEDFEAADTVTYAGLDLDDYQLDQYCAYLAADDLKTVEGEANPLITAKIPVLEAKIAGNVAPSFQSFKKTGYCTYPHTRWHKTSPTQIRLYR